jgi:predicted DsbA family dithiol-disulfide isomerase
MKIEIWSDVMCPFCYIGKRKFEKALSQFENKNEIEIEWKSFQLDPTMESQPNKTINEYLAERKGMSVERAKQMNYQVSQMAAAEGLEYHLAKAVVANSFDAHQFVQFAKTKGKGDEAEEALFKAYFTDSKNISSHDLLVELTTEIGLDKEELKRALQQNEFADKVKQDIYEASQIGVTGVPFFVFNNKYAISGAQPSETFLQALHHSFNEFTSDLNQQSIGSSNDNSCTIDGNCN